MQFKAKYFNELSTCELYEILKARSEIFVVEQEILYQDMDDIDYNSLHMFIENNGRVEAYLRAFPKKDEENVIHIGRVLSVSHGNGLGGRLLHESLEYIRENIKPSKIYIEAQCHAIGFYEREGFVVRSEEFLEDGIPHVKMELNLS